MNRSSSGTSFRAALVAFVAFVAGCTAPDADGAGFRAEYQAARAALEAGDYGLAAERYGRLVAAGGPLAPRLRLEYAHALLRADDPDGAAREARLLAAGQSGAARAAALAVLGAAEHERARRAMAEGDFGPGTEAALLAARAALDEALAGDWGVDPLGGLAARRAAIGSDLARLGAGRSARG